MKNRIRRIGRSLVLVAAIVGGAAAPVRAQDVGAVAEASALLAAYPARVAESLGRIRSIPAIPWVVVYKCGYSCLGKLCFMELTYQGTANFEWVKPNVEAQARRIEAPIRTFTAEFSRGVANWTATLAPTEAAFGDAVRRVGAVQSSIRAGVGPTEAQRAEVAAALGAIRAALETGLERLQQASSSLGRHLEQAERARKQIASSTARMRGQIDQTATNLRRSIAAQKCAGSGFAQVESHRAASLGLLNVMAQEIDKIRRHGEDADRALKVVLGTMTGFASRYRTLTDQIAATDAAPLGGVIQRLRLDVARQGWVDFARAAERAGL